MAKKEESIFIMGRRTRPPTKMARLRIQDIQKLQEYARRSGLSLTEYVNRLTRNLR